MRTVEGKFVYFYQSSISTLLTCFLSQCISPFVVVGYCHAPGHDGVDAVLPLVQHLVQVAVADADLGDLDGDILGAQCAAGELEWLQGALGIMCANTNGRSAWIETSRC